ncbi:DUF1800 domain-containing protein [Salipiger sp. P9]|uniref:DUF1800 domain-containing protein n=1 Tax=Salipiger pentaromativorans TaxID=2943193 RepID=UPI0021570D34|nr:DUF1800 domain-containing protein [Salipiger pentaromativorans]MCR8549006.1 DUF1800 domain-containing protein [Salipiger pentaromativorans]
MAAFDPVLADIRFGCGLSPALAPAPDAAAFLATLTGPDDSAARHPVERFETFLTRLQEVRKYQQIRRKNRGTPEGLAARDAIRDLNKVANVAQLHWMAQRLARRVTTAAPFRERLAAFWADHFTATGKAGVMRRAGGPYVESAIRPRLAGKFEDLLIAAVTHPLMVHYLDQERSAGPNSKRAQSGDKKLGLNENLAREIMELHTLGVGGPYTQTDVRELAELLTGLTMNRTVGRQFRKDMAEPGAETVLGKRYGGGQPRFSDIEAVLRDLARHPATARHLAGKLATHFVSDSPDPALTGAIEAALLESGTDLKAGYEAMLAHPAAWSTRSPNVKRPFDFIASALRALEVPPETFLSLKPGMFRRRFHVPMVLMGHVWEKPVGPDGLPEEDSAWITPQGLAARLQWAVTVPQLLQDELPDPRAFVTQALGPRATPAVHLAAKAAESRADGIGLVLASPSFQRM